MSQIHKLTLAFALLCIFSVCKSSVPDVIGSPKHVIAKPKHVTLLPQYVFVKPKHVVAKPKHVIAKPKDVIGLPKSVLNKSGALLKENEGYAQAKKHLQNSTNALSDQLKDLDTRQPKRIQAYSLDIGH